MVPCTTASFVAGLLSLVFSVTGSSDEVGGIVCHHDGEGCATEASSLELLQKEISLEQRETKAALKRGAQKHISPGKLVSEAAPKKDAFRDPSLLSQKRMEEQLLPGIGHHMILEDSKEQTDSSASQFDSSGIASRMLTQLRSAALPAAASTGAIIAAVSAFLVLLACCICYLTGAEEKNGEPDYAKAVSHGGTLLQGQYSPRTAERVAAASMQALRSGATPEEAAAAGKASLARQQRQGKREQRQTMCGPC